MADLNSIVNSFNREEEEAIAQAAASQLGVSYIKLSDYPLSKEALGVFPDEEIEKYCFIPYIKIGKKVKIACLNPENPSFQKFISDFAAENGLEISIALISETSYNDSLKKYKQLAVDNKVYIRPIHDYKDELINIAEIAEKAKRISTTELLELLISGAVKLNASDIHIEPSESDFLTRFRIDGVLQDVITLPLHSYKQLLSRIMYLSEMKMDMSNKPQDGSFSLKLPGTDSIDIRTSIMPSAYGESIVLRLLGQEKSILSLDSFGFRNDALMAIKNAISMPHGMILTSGPTGSGKTSTMYSILLYLRKPGVKIITLENPVEFRIDGIEQSPVHPGEGYDFPDGLRASLRQDPDVLMVGEIRDGETAETAVQAALTGHLLLSTVHANSAPAVFVRLLEIGVRPFLLAGSINLIMAQRLVRKICPACKEEYAPSQEEINYLKTKLDPIAGKLPEEINNSLKSSAFSLHRGKGCEKCNNTGYSGRQVVTEYIVPNSDIEELVARKASISEFESLAQKQGMITMEQDGLLKVLQGTTTLEEVLRVTKMA